MTGVLLSVLCGLAGIVGAILGDLLSEEVRRRLDRVPIQLMHLACRRLPEPARADRADEWAAELAAILIRRGATKLPVTRLVVGIRFALGLFVATPAIGRATRRPRSSRLLGAAYAVVAAALAVPILAMTIGAQLTAVIAEFLMFAAMGRVVLVATRFRDRQAGSAGVALLPFAALFVMDLVRRTVGSAPMWIFAAVGVTVMLQPVVTLHFTDRVQPMSRRFRVFAAAACSTAAILIALTARPLSPAVLLLTLGPVTVLQCATGTMIIWKALRRQAPDKRFKLMICGVATTLIGIAMANLYAGALPGSNPNFDAAVRITALTAAFGYVLIVAPPRRLRLPWTRKDSLPAAARARTVADG